MERHELDAEVNKMIEKLKAVFLLAGIDVKSFHQLPNGYCGDQCCPHRPWGLAETKYGLIKIGWRKRVISIEWSKELNIHGNNTLAKDEQKTDKSCGTTSWENGVHAWGWAKAVSQMTNFVELAERDIFRKEGDARLTPAELVEFNELSDTYSKNSASLDQARYSRLQALLQKRRPPQN